MNRRPQLAIVAAATFAFLVGQAQHAHPAVLDQAAVDNAMLRGDYRRIASCSYERLDKIVGAGLKKVDLDGSTRLALESGGVKYWELVFLPSGKGETRVELTAAQTLWGPSSSAKSVMPQVHACGGPAPPY